MKNTFFHISITLLCITALLASKPANAQDKLVNYKKITSSAALKTSMNTLFENQVIWTRNLILCEVDSLPGKEDAINRLMKNQVDIGNAIKPFYGEAAGKSLTILLRTHIQIMAEVIKQTNLGKTNALNIANKRWYDNADEIAMLFGKLNPNWASSEIKLMIHNHLSLTKEEAVQRIKKDYVEDIIAFDRVHNEFLEISDQLSDDIIRQFPGKFQVESAKTALK